MRSRLALVLGVLALVAGACQYTEQVSVGINSNVVLEDISGDGRYVLFRTTQGVAAGDTNNLDDYYRRDTLTNTDLWVSPGGGFGLAETRGAAMSDDGNRVVFDTTKSMMPIDTNSFSDVFLYTVSTGLYSRLSESTGDVAANNLSIEADISGNGSVVVFRSLATNLVASDLNGVDDIFAHVISSDATVRVSTTAAGGEADGPSFTPSINSAGTAVAFASAATNLAPTFTAAADIFVKHVSGTVELISVAAGGVGGGNGTSARPRIDASGTTVTFSSFATDLVSPSTPAGANMYVRLTNFGLTLLLQPGNEEASVSANGAVVTSKGFWYEPTISGPTPIAIKDALPVPGSGMVSADGRYIAFVTSAQLTPGDTDAFSDIFVVSTRDPEVTSVSPSSLPIGQATAITIHGSGFEPGATAKGQNPTVTLSNVVYQGPNTLTATATVSAGASPGLTGVNVFNPDGGPGPNSGGLFVCLNCVTLTN